MRCFYDLYVMKGLEAQEPPVSILRGFLEPARGFRLILRTADAAVVHARQMIHGVVVAGLRCFLIPAPSIW